MDNMQNQGYTIIFLFLTSFAFGQTGMIERSYKRLPKDNKMVDTSLVIYNLLRNGEFEKLKYKNPNNVQWVNEIQLALPFFKNGIPEDTTLTEWLKQKETEIVFTINCDKLEKGLVYKLILYSKGITGTVDNFMFYVKRDTTCLKIRKALLELPLPQKN